MPEEQSADLRRNDMSGYPYHRGSCGVGFVCHTRGIKSHTVVRWGIEAVGNLTHRGAVGADGKTGDGAGILIQIPRKFFLDELRRTASYHSGPDNLAVGSFFLYEDLQSPVEEVLTHYGFRVAGWREVPTDDNALGLSALSTKPRIRQVLLDTEQVPVHLRESRLYLARRTVEARHGQKVYVPSLSTRIIVYKGMLVGTHIGRFYPELEHEDFASSFCIFHQRFSTNTFPDWASAQPLRALAHNGEINTVKGNRNWMSYIEHDISHELFGGDNGLIRPLISFAESDSASLDRVVELLLLTGRSPEHAINMCVPPAWEDSGLDSSAKAFLEFASLLMKPWDGPAAIVLTDGNRICAHLDRNGLRPMRYVITEDDHMVLGSEAGMVDLGDSIAREKGRLGPGDTLSVDTVAGVIKYTSDILGELSKKAPYRTWLQGLYRMEEDRSALPPADPDLPRKQAAFGYTSEEIRTAMKAMAETGIELTYSMGDDTPIPPLSEKPQLLYRYFKQRFSQVTNPPIDPIREKTVMSLKMALGRKRNFLVESKEHATRMMLSSPVLFEREIDEIGLQQALKTERITATYPSLIREADSKSPSGPSGESAAMTCCTPAAQTPLLLAVSSLQEKVLRAAEGGAEIIILSDKGVSAERVAIPALLAVAACFTVLHRQRMANRTSIVVETGEARDIHQLACLIGYGASAVYPYLALQTIGDLCGQKEVSLPYENAAANYRRALEEGLLKVIARMGISTLNSYHGARLFDSVCLNEDFVTQFFQGTSVTIESDGMSEIEESLMRRHDRAFGPAGEALDQGGNLRHRKGGEWHQWSTSTVLALNKFIKAADPGRYEEFFDAATARPVFIRHLLTYEKGKPLPIEEVESEEAVLKRFFSGAMSVGALSPEAHETIAEACNTLCIRSNSGEGGEDPARYWTVRNSAIKQIASGRFGVTPAYLASADELEIKIAQGAKPGEGGHLPSAKVTEYIARLRHCSPGILLISPPPHHDIYSIEDLAQLINDLKETNPKARVCVKLVSEPGVGAVAAGVVKAYADVVQISGCEGGTGASPVGSIKNAGNYWEIGLAETQRVLMENGLRDKVRVRVDGGLSTGRDIIIAALLGAEEYGFGTATMISTGCIMARQCHLNTCPTGIATQDERLRAKFRGTVEGVTSYFSAVARQVRGILAEIGVRSIDEIVGRADLLRPASYDAFPAAKRVAVMKIFEGYGSGIQGKCKVDRNNNPAPSMNDKLLDDLLPYIERAEPVAREYAIRNVDRSVPLRLNYHISLRYKDRGLPDDTLRLTFRGTAGQSFGAFNHNGLSLTLIGDANDYVGKGMFGGRIAIQAGGIGELRGQVIAGNTALYGATGGQFFAAGKAGERFAVRNSGSIAVVEGTGHHLCEYMTRGVVVVLGEAGFNVGAGMTGGVIYILDERNALEARLNGSYVRSSCIDEAQEAMRLKSLIENHSSYAKSLRAAEILDDFERFVPRFRKVVPL